MTLRKKPHGKTQLRQWMDEQYRKTSGLKKRVDALVEEPFDCGCVALAGSLPQRLGSVRRPD